MSHWRRQNGEGSPLVRDVINNLSNIGTFYIGRFIMSNTNLERFRKAQEERYDAAFWAMKMEHLPLLIWGGFEDDD